jgi:hypothetical protein
MKHLYAAVSSQKRRAQRKVVEMILPEGKNAVARCSPGWIAVSAIAIFLMIINNLHVAGGWDPLK